MKNLFIVIGLLSVALATSSTLQSDDQLTMESGLTKQDKHLRSSLATNTQGGKTIGGWCNPWPYCICYPYYTDPNQYPDCVCWIWPEECINLTTPITDSSAQKLANKKGPNATKVAPSGAQKLANIGTHISK